MHKKTPNEPEIWSYRLDNVRTGAYLFFDLGLEILPHPGLWQQVERLQGNLSFSNELVASQWRRLVENLSEKKQCLHQSEWQIQDSRRGGRGYGFIKFSQKLYEIEKILDASATHSRPRSTTNPELPESEYNVAQSRWKSG